jgi:hypothetical protein
MVFAMDAPQEAGKPFLVATSLGTGPIPIDTRRLNLTPDTMMVVSSGGALPSVFVNYAGSLSAIGKSSCAINIPNLPVLKGIALHTAYVTLDAAAPSGISAISNTFSFTIS